jgi:hypothetical protein
LLCREVKVGLFAVAVRCLERWMGAWWGTPGGDGGRLQEGAITFRLKFCLLLLLTGAYGVGEQLGHVGQGDGVAAGDALASQLADEVAKEEIDLVGGHELMDAVASRSLVTPHKSQVFEGI